LLLADTAVAARAFFSSTELPELTIDIGFPEYQALLDQRAAGLAEGVVISGEADFQPAEITLREPGAAPQVAPVRVRLRQGLADGLGEDGRWPLEVRTRDGSRLYGLRRFTLQDPAENNGDAQWAFARAAADAGLLAAQTHFVSLILNGRPLGVYAFQEGYAQELLARSGRGGEIILEVDPEPVWRAVAAYQGDRSAAFADPFLGLSAADFHFLAVDAFREASALGDPALAAQMERAVALMRSLQAGRPAAGEVFDVERMGRFLALADLWGAADALGLANLRYAYDPESDRLEPIAGPGNPLGEGRVPAEALYDDPALQRSYLAAAAELSRPELLEAWRISLEPEWSRLRRALGPQAATEAPWDWLVGRQELIRRSLEPARPLLAFLGRPAPGAIQIDVANIYRLPVQIVGFDGAGLTLPVDAAWVTQADEGAVLDGPAGELVLAAAGEPPLRYVRFVIPVTALDQAGEWPGDAPVEFEVISRLPGQGPTQRSPARPGYPLPAAPPGPP
jgi:hypothetical protein